MPNHPDIERVLITTDVLNQRVRDLGAAITEATSELDDVMLVGILKGSLMFLADLARAVQRTVQLDFIAVASYGASTESSGVVRLNKDLDLDISGKHVILVEDIVDSGLTLSYVSDLLRRRNPASIHICTLLNKPERRMVDLEVAYVGFDIPNEFVVGYGLDYAEHYRNLPYIGVLKRSVYS